MAGQVWGGIEAGVLSLSIIACITFLVMWKLMVLSDHGRQSSKRSLHRSVGTHLWRASIIISCVLLLCYQLVSFLSHAIAVCCDTDARICSETFCSCEGHAGRQGSRAEHKKCGPDIIYLVWLHRVTLFASAVVMFILLVVGVSKYTKSHLGHKFIPWPHWAWWIAVINSWLWAGLAIVAHRGVSRVQRHCIESKWSSSR